MFPFGRHCATGVLCLLFLGSFLGRGAEVVEVPFVTGVDLQRPRSDFSGWVGMQFTVGHTALRVTSLGRTFLPGNSEVHSLKLVGARDGFDVVGGVTEVSMVGGTNGEFVYGVLTDEVILEPFTSYYLVSREVEGGDAWYDFFTMVNSTSVAAVDGAIWSPADNSFYATAGIPGNSYGAVDFKYRADPGLFPPYVVISEPTPGAAFLPSDTISWSAEVTEAGAMIDRVEFLCDGDVVGTDSSPPYAMEYAAPSVGEHELQCVAVDDAGARGSSAVVSVRVVLPVEFIAPVSLWHYWDQGGTPPAGWKTSEDALGWEMGDAPLGYGSGLVETAVDYGPDASNKHVTTYFRERFVVDDALAFPQLQFEMLRDDGVVMHLNGVELMRDLMPEGVIESSTLALSDVDLLTDQGRVQGTVSGQLLTNGTNVLAVEVHQFAPDSPDLLFQLQLSGWDPGALVTRGPYLQQGGTSRVVVRWRTDRPVTSRVRYGTNLHSLDRSVQSGESTTEHAIVLDELEPDTRYYYSIGTVGLELEVGEDLHFVTAPVAGKPTRIWVLGDSGTANVNAKTVRDAYYQFTGDRHTDLWLMLGDNAYPNGTDADYQAAVFDMYPEMLRKSVLWSVIGNHDTATSASPPPDFPYLNIFELPTGGEVGGLASGTERYYSFDYGNVHFVCLDSMSSDRSKNGVMCAWLRSDLAANTNEWLLALWHHPPYSKGSHDSDTSHELIEMRENVVPILEEHGVDLVLSGHSHSYERSFLLRGHYGASWSLTAGMVMDGGTGRVDETGEYRKTNDEEGAVFVVAGSSGQVKVGTFDHPVMVVSALELGSVVLDVHGRVLEAKFLGSDGIVHDQFVMVKGEGNLGPFEIEADSFVNGSFTISWPSVAGEVYAVERSLGLESPDWSVVSPAMVATGGVSSRTIVVSPGDSKAFYRVVGGDGD